MPVDMIHLYISPLAKMSNIQQDYANYTCILCVENVGIIYWFLYICLLIWVNDYISSVHNPYWFISMPAAITSTGNFWYFPVVFLQSTCNHTRHPIACPLGQAMGCLLWVQNLTNALFAIQCGAVITRSIFSQIFTKDTHSSSGGARYGVRFVDPVSDWHSPLVHAIINVIFYNIGPRYNGTRLYCVIQ